MAPVGIASTRTRASADPIFMIAPLPQFFSICAIARFNAFFLSSLTVETAISFHPVVRRLDRQSQNKGGGLPPEQNTKLGPENQVLVAKRKAFSMCWTRTFPASRM